jgi:sulfide dehydrogenase cytochrome subunit
VGGASAGKTMPSIGGQPAEYLKTVLQQYKTGDRYSTIMGRLLKGYTDAELAALADYYSKQKWVAAGETPDPALVQKGQQIHAGKCAGCHGPKGEMAQAMIPRLAGQWSGFIELELQTYADPKLKMPSQMMQSAVAGLSADDFRALGAFYASQK